MNIDREIVEAVVRLLNTALNAEGDVFGVDHNEATDVVGTLELLLLAALKEAIKQPGEPVGYLLQGHYEGLHYFTKSKVDAERLAKTDSTVVVTPLYTSAPTIPEGWRLVPEEATPEMLNAAGASVHPAGYWRTAYKAMLAAAPTYQGDKP